MRPPVLVKAVIGCWTSLPRTGPSTFLVRYIHLDVLRLCLLLGDRKKEPCWHLLEFLGLDPITNLSRTSLVATRQTTMDLIRQAFALTQDSKNNKWISPLLILGDICLSFLIIQKISCKPKLQKNIYTPYPTSQTNPPIQTPKSTGTPTCNKSPSTSPAN